MSIDISTLIQIGTSLFTAVTGWMLKSVYSDFKDAMKSISKHEVRIAVLEEQVEKLEDRWLRANPNE